jgi:hypothetical protein
MNFFHFYQKEVAAESKSMIPDTNRRLKMAIEDLKSLMVRINWKTVAILSFFCYH